MLLHANIKQLLLFYDDLHVATREMYVQYLPSQGKVNIVL